MNTRNYIHTVIHVQVYEMIAKSTHTCYVAEIPIIETIDIVKHKREKVRKIYKNANHIYERVV